ncbi:SRPBCC family protein [Chthonobacter albigriseus]|uniref:SRPBCC family protein n=1 Tax=Chthonobacter albigriseus TaxID=1683161 RepID=UPI0015EED06B|nr:SRPBCC family protein [Chthonobacter albigriseus]
MKWLVVSGMLVVAMSAPAAAAGAKYRAESQSADALKAWEVIGDFCAIATWHPDVATCVMGERDGKPARTVTLKDGGVIVDKLDAYDPSTLTYVISTVESPWPIQWMMAKLSTKPDDEGGAGVKWVGTFEPKAGTTDADAKIPVEAFFKRGVDGIFSKLGVEPKVEG